MINGKFADSPALGTNVTLSPLDHLLDKLAAPALIVCMMLTVVSIDYFVYSVNAWRAVNVRKSVANCQGWEN